MANYNSLKATIDAQIKANGVQAITGPILNAVLTAMINTIGNGYTLQGSVAQTTDNPGAPDNPVAYLAAGPGTYTNFGGTVIPDDGHAYLLTWDTSWHAVQLPLPTFDLANGKQDALTFDDAPTPGSDNPVKSNGIAEALDTKQEKDTGDTAGHVAVMDGNGNSVDGGEALADLATKEDVEAVEQEVAQIAGEAGLAEAVIDTDNAGTEQEFTFRKSGGDGGAYYRKIKGKTIAWNQLVAVPSPRGSDTLVNPLVLGHKYYLRANVVQGANPGVIFLNIQGDASRIIIRSDTASGLQRLIFTEDITNAYLFMAYSYANPGDDINQIGCTDLTILYGSEIDGMSDAEILAKYEAEYGAGLYPYNPGTLISNDAEAVETTGANQWDEEWELGVYNYTTGQPTPSTEAIRSKNYIPIFPNTAYYFKVPGTSSLRILWYDANGNFISSQTNGDYNNTIQTSPANAYFMRFGLSSAYGTTYNHDICINISNSAINGQYFPYWKRTLQLGLTTKEDTDGNVPFADGMKGAGTAADWADKVGGEKRIGRVDLGSLVWAPAINGRFIALTALPNAKDSNGSNTVCAKYAPHANSNVYGDTADKYIVIDGDLRIIVNDSAFASYTGEQVAAALSGVFLDYEFAAPVPFTWKEPLNLGVKVDENGTERAVAPEGATAPSAPFVADTTYTMSIARMVAILQGI